MKKLITTALVLMLSFIGSTQEKNIETDAVTIDNLITFVVENYSVKKDSTNTKNITFLIETYADGFNTEDRVILKQAFKLLTKRVTDNDLISIVMYSNYNGVALNQVKATDIKKLLYVIEHPKSSVKTLQDDGVEVAYTLTKENFIEAATNAVVMLRLPNRQSHINNAIANVPTTQHKKKSNTLVLTAIALLPEIIAVKKIK
ncbi:hypothetical protein N8475_03525 [Winogradskyella sp.]|nr:hypothetical protein [Winogradskyella sp.]